MTLFGHILPEWLWSIGMTATLALTLLIPNNSNTPADEEEADDADHR